ncbi:autotransporter outer membrane beta-barrel domain-containing protein [Helicobacter mesocricetorum]|uniref:autotransporter outer membrane beta-barrel domain-containing protein n=1 Tax=Helicobacter mesocricetorum TaxID=87012 RepID=UPI001F3EAE42|nr:autotransporter outer membrane beta-barrel domain-containing protein [Helicobacter mesocricetorum]
MKISLIASRALIGFSVLGSIAAYAVDITNNTDFTNNFQNNNGNWSVKADSKIQSEGVTLKKLEKFEQPLNNITLSTDKKITIDTNVEVGSYTDKNDLTKAYSFNINAKEGVDNNGTIDILRDSKIEANTSLKTNSRLNIVGSKLDIIGNVSAEDNSIITLTDTTNMNDTIRRFEESVLFGDDNTNTTDTESQIDFNDLIRSANALGISSGIPTLNIKGNFETKGATTFEFHENGFINTTGKATINSQGSLNFNTSNSPLTSDKTLLFAQGGVDIVKTANNQNSSVLTQQGDKTWKPSEGGILNVTYDREVASYLSNPSLLNGIIVPRVEDLKSENLTYEIRVDEKKNNLFIKVNVDNSKINTTSLKNIKDEKELQKAQDEFLKTQLKTTATSTKTALETAKKNLETAKTKYNEISTSNKAAITKNIDLAIQDIDANLKSTQDINSKTDATAQEYLSALLKGADTKTAEDVLVTLIDKKDNKLFNATLDTEVLKNTTTSISRSEDTRDGLNILKSLSTSAIDTDTILSVITNQNFFKDTREQAQTISQLSDTSSSQLGAINIANDVAIGDRIARFNNPHIETKRFAALSSDVAYSYYDEYVSSVWANVFGGANIIGGNTGGLYGLSIGVDRNISSNVLLGGYFTYADSTFKSKTTKQKTNNFQAGLYSLVKLTQDWENWEIRTKAYAQLSPTDQYSTNILGTDSADFTKKFFGINGSLGKVFQISNDFFVKPFAGMNYYYGFTPNYTESGTTLAKNVRSSTNNALSLDLGAELRKYFGSNSYLFITPKLEQYIIHTGSDYVARFAGSTSAFRIANNEKTKTYGQLVLGGNVNINQNLSLNIGGGLKQILAGKSPTNETYLNGNIQLKYKF